MRSELQCGVVESGYVWKSQELVMLKDDDALAFLDPDPRCRWRGRSLSPPR